MSSSLFRGWCVVYVGDVSVSVGTSPLFQISIKWYWGEMASMKKQLIIHGQTTVHDYISPLE
jgi:hypothetical protein